MSENLKNYKKNLTNVLFEQLVRLILSFLYTIALTKQIGLENYGQLSLVLSVTVLFSVLIHQGMEMVCIKKLVEQQEDADLILSTAVVMQLIGALLSIVVIQLFVHFMSYDNSYLYLISSSTALIGAATCIKYEYHAKVQGYVISRINTINYIIFLFVKLVVIQYSSNIGYLLVVDFIAMTFLVFMYIRKSKFKIFQVLKKANYNIAITITKSSRYVAYSSVALLVFTKVDQLIISKYLGLTENGLYAFTASIVAASYFIPTVVSTTFYPRLINASKNNELLNSEMQKQLSFISLMSIFIVSISIGGYPFFIDIVMGVEYEGTKVLFSIMMLAFIPISLGVVSNKWYFVKKMEKLLLRRTIGGAVIAVTFSLLTVEEYGVNGVAFAFLVSHLYSGVLANLFSKGTRQIFLMQIKSLYFSGIFSVKRV
ncbi:oligosaccharide flippase family protein [Limnobacter sp.]|uniref:oligosaccharide flippase family protein n=1 Tax=Limnobacter sp. TaxID=2003368 RepID=UPI00311EC771